MEGRWCHRNSNQGRVSPNRAGLLVSPQASPTTGDASDITIPSWILNNDELCPVDTRAGKKRRRTKWRGRRWSNPLCDNSINSQLFHLTSGSTVMCSAPYKLYSVCALLAKLSKILWSSNRENFAPVAACLVVHHQIRDLVPHQTALRSSHLEVIPWLCAPGSSGTSSDLSPRSSLEQHSTPGTT